jgi:alpha-glucosidase
MMVDAGWSNVYDIKKPNPKVDIRDIIDHATSKHVGVFVWCVATSLMNDLDGNLDYLKSLGAAGVKIDFFDRDDQLAIQLFEKIAMAAAKRKLMVDFHGCSKPTGLQKTYPNIINYESVRGEECDKWDYTANPDQHLLIPFIRMLAGPLDYTPGGMRNKSKEKYKPIGAGLPSSEGTRCHELALFVLFDQPLGVLADSPAEYMKYPDCMSFLSAVPTVFDDTRVLDAKLGEYALIAKRKQNNWFIGAISNWDQRELKLNFAFLPEGKTYQADVYTDATDANENAEHYVHKTITISNHTKTNLTLAKGGGAVIYIHQ